MCGPEPGGIDQRCSALKQRTSVPLVKDEGKGRGGKRRDEQNCHIYERPPGADLQKTARNMPSSATERHLQPLGNWNTPRRKRCERSRPTFADEDDTGLAQNSPPGFYKNPNFAHSMYYGFQKESSTQIHRFGGPEARARKNAILGKYCK